LNPLVLLLSLIYMLCAALLVGYGLGILVLLALYLRHRAGIASPPPPDRWPSVVVQLPIYNEAHVAERLIDAMAALDYPRDCLSIQVLDDSTDHTTALVQARVEHHRAAGVDIRHLCRATRQGYKAGALAYGLRQTQAEMVAVFDADFIPSPGFLRQTVPYLLADPRVGMVQARWGHLNAEHNLLTRAQALAIDTHFIIEQTARSRSGLTLVFNGSAGIWRRACIEDAGGWQDHTLSEDMDLSYRAQLCGWRCILLPHVEVPGEIPPQIAAYKRQQARWAKGTTQCLLLHGPRLLRSGMGLFRALMGLLHLCQYLTQPLMLILMLLTVPLMLSGALQHLNLSLLGLAGVGPILAYALSQRALYPRWPLQFLAALPALIFLGVGATFNNTLAVCSALANRPNTFRRTPKFGRHRWQASHYALLAGRNVIGEVAIALYATAGAILAIRYDNPAAIPLFLTYALSCGGVALITLVEARRVTRWAPGLP
jgi:cellulose synthase/poly-beta-1,6-N-acetylglucosamine synthase-like glycosyltransferase